MLSQMDVARLSDDDIKGLVMLLHPIAMGDGPFARVALRFGMALISAKRERDRAVLVLEAEAMNHHGPGLFLGDSNAAVDASGGEYA